MGARVGFCVLVRKEQIVVAVVNCCGMHCQRTLTAGGVCGANEEGLCIATTDTQDGGLE